MKRKVIQIAGKTYVLSIPTHWIKQYGINKGDELEVTEKGPTLVVGTGKQRTIKTSSINSTKLDERALRWTLSSLHKKGYDQIELTLDDKQHTIVEELIKDLFIGFAIVHKTKNTCTIRSVSQDLDDQFDTILRRAFIVTLQLAEQTHELAKESKPLQALLTLEKTNNQLTNFCERTLNKKGHPDTIKTSFLYVIIWNLEKIADDYKYLCQHLNKKKTNTQALMLLNETNKLLREYYELYYNFKLENLSTLAQKFKTLENKITRELEKNEDPITLSHLHHIVLKIADFSASTAALNS
ncbi:AbrB/MazE/SpoVT family DNA-binding domain-containing protein [Candidatus Woesearchaeota archaeon]|nr:AbrB/MazE/SpoVT family DNA-binding domain-containing protein [Candidatus Woesearchaeota archaeon]